MDIDTLMTKWRCECAIVPAECSSSVCGTEKKQKKYVNVKGDHLYQKPTPEGGGSGATVWLIKHPVPHNIKLSICSRRPSSNETQKSRKKLAGVATYASAFLFQTTTFAWCTAWLAAKLEPGARRATITWDLLSGITRLQTDSADNSLHSAANSHASEFI